MTLDEALRITMKATELAAAGGVSIAIAVVDAGGHLITLHRMDGVPFIAAEIAWGKACTAAAWGETSSDQAAKAAALPPVRHRHHRRQRRPVHAASRGNPPPPGRHRDRRGRRQRPGQWPDRPANTPAGPGRHRAGR